MTQQRTSSRPNKGRLLAGMVAAGLAFSGLAAIMTSPAQAALPPECVTVGANVTCTFTGYGSTGGSTGLEIPAHVTSIQIHAVGERGGRANTPGSSNTLARGGDPAVIDAPVPVTKGEVITVGFLNDGGAPGTDSDGGVDAGWGGASVMVTRGPQTIAHAAGGGGAGALEPLLEGGSSSGGDAGAEGGQAESGGGDLPAGGGLGATESEGGEGGNGARLYSCSGGTTFFPDGSPGSSSGGGSGADGQYPGGGGGGGSYGGGGGGAGGVACESWSYGGGGGGGASTVPSGGSFSVSTTESYLVRITFTVRTDSTHSPSAMSFGQVPVGSTSAAQTITVANTGSAPLTLGNGVLSGTNSGSFLKAGDTCSNKTVAPGATCQVGLQFKPLTSGNLSATFTITDNSSSSPHIVTLSGTGTRPIAVASVSTLAFGAQEVGKTGPAKTVSLMNTGSAPLVVSSTRFGGTNAADFSTLSNGCTGSTVAPGSSCSVSIHMTASAVGNRVGTFTFSHNAAQPSSVVSLSGSGTPPADLKILGIGSVYTGRDHLVTRTVAGPGKLATYPLVILNEDTVARSYTITLTKTGSAATAEVWTTGINARPLSGDGSGNPGRYITAEILPMKSVTYSLRVTPTAAGQTVSGVAVSLLSHHGGLIEGLTTETNTPAPAHGTSSFELFSKVNGHPFVGGPVSGQTSTGPALNVGGPASFTLRLKNNGGSSQRIGLRLTDIDGCAGSFTVTVTAAGKVVTTAAFNGSYLTPVLAPWRYQDVFVTIKRVAAGCPSKTIRAQSLNGGTVVRTSYLLANAAYNAATD